MFSIINTIDETKLEEILTIVKKAELQEDVSSYASGRQRTWINLNWDLKSKTFSTFNCIRNKNLWNILTSIWPQAEIGLLTYSGGENPKGISLHRDDSYGDYESYGIQLTGTCEFIYMGGYRDFKWDNNKEPEIKQSYNLEPGQIYRFNCKNKHAAIPSIERYAINLWKISDKFRKEYNETINKLNIQPLF